MHLAKPVDIDRLTEAVIELAARPPAQPTDEHAYRIGLTPPTYPAAAAATDPAALFAMVWDALAEVLGTAAIAAIIRRAAGRAAAVSPEFVDVVIRREDLEYRYTLPHAWSQPEGGAAGRAGAARASGADSRDRAAAGGVDGHRRHPPAGANPRAARPRAAVAAEGAN